MKFVRITTTGAVYLSFICFQIFGQEPQLNQSLIAPTPDVVAFAKNGLTPVTLYTGIPNISIPIIELKLPKLSLPINLTYNYNGYEPNQDASWVGMGWNVDAGGVITRIVKGQYDEKLNSINYHWDDYANVGDLINNQDYMHLAGDGHVDTEPDLYIFNFSGRSGKFILVGDNAFLFPYQDIIIKRAGTSFIIITEDGTIYTFGQGSSSQETTTIPETDISYISAWHLSKIQSADLKDVIDFSYATFSARPGLNTLSETYTISYKVPNGCDATFGGQGWGAQWNLGGTVGAKRLTKITTRNATLDFIPEDNPRLDIGGADYKNAYALKEIDIKNSGGVLLKKAILNHAYFPGNTQLKLSSFVMQGNYNQLNASETYSFLYQSETSSFPKGTRGIDKWGYYNGKDINSMLFDQTLGLSSYSYALGDRTVDPNYCARGILSRITYPTGGYTTFEYENNRIATVGLPQFLHDTRTVGDIVFYSGSTAYRSIYGSFTINEEQDVYVDYSRDISNYSYGILNTYNILTICRQNGESGCSNVYSSPLIHKLESGNCSTLHLTPGAYIYTITCEQGVISSTAHIRYYWVNTSQQVYIPGPGMRIKTIKAYDIVNSGTPAITKNYTYADAKLLNSNEFGFNIIHHRETNTCMQEGTICSWEDFDEYVYTSDYANPLLTLVNNQFYYPQVTEISYNEIGSGKTEYNFKDGGSTEALSVYLSLQNDYSFKNNQYILLKSSITDEKLINPINFTALTYKLSQTSSATGSGQCVLSEVNNPNIYDTILRDKIYTASIYNLVCAYNRLNYTRDIVYDQDGQNPITNEVDYYYDNPKFIAPTRKVSTNSEGQNITILLKYPLDYATNCNSMYDIIQTFKANRDNASIAYQQCVSQRQAAAWAIMQNKTGIHQAFYPDVKAVLRSYKCEEEYKTNTFSNVKNPFSNSCMGMYSGCSGGSASIAARRNKNIVDDPVEQIHYVTKNNADYFLSALKTDYTIDGIYPKLLYSTKHASSDILLSAFNNAPNDYYDGKINFVYDGNNNLYRQYKTNDLQLDYLWGYNNTLPVAQLAWNKPTSDNYTNYYAYTSFESDGKGNWAFNGTPVSMTSATGKYCYQLNSDISISNLDPGLTFWITYWTKNTGAFTVTGASSPQGTKGKKVGLWTFYEHQVQPTASGKISFSGSGYIDELRLYTLTGQMTTYTYEPLVGMTSQCDINNKITYYDYDGLGRLKLLLDQDKNILKKICYSYAEQMMNCDATVYYNDELHNTFAKSNCSTGYYGTPVFYSVPAGKYSSTNNAAEANNLATADLNTNGQNYANLVGTCKPISTVTINSTVTISGAGGFIATYTNVATGAQTSFSIPQNGGNLGTLPSGIYNLTVSKIGNNTMYLFQPGCDQMGISGKSATFYTIEVTSFSCNTVTIASNN